MGNNDPSTNDNHEERRSKPRIYEPFPAMVRGVDMAGQTFEADTLIDNLGSGGVYLRLTQFVNPGAQLFIVIRLSKNSSNLMSSPRAAARGRVLRCDPQPNALFGLAVAFTRRRFF